MSNIYIQEPPTSGKVCLETTVGDIDIELWAREAPKACRNFVQLCMESYYDGTIFHRLVKGFIVQGGDPTGTGTGGNSIYGSTFKDEFHQRLRFVRRGLVAMANSGPNDNGSQFFFTLAQTPELQNKHTIFAKVAGDTIYNMLKLEESLVEDEDRPIYPHKILKAKILNNPFDDIVPREIIKRTKIKSEKKGPAGTKNLKLLSFGDEAEEESEEIDLANKKFAGKGKSSHDLTNDPKLSSELAINPSEFKKKSSKAKDDDDDREESDLEEDVEKEDDNDNKDDDQDDFRKRIHEKLNKKKDSKKSKKKEKGSSDKTLDDEEDVEKVATYYLGKRNEEEQQRKLAEIKNEMRSIRKEMKDKDRIKEDLAKQEKDSLVVKNEQLAASNSLIKSFLDEQKMYKEKQSSSKKKGSDREAQTLALLNKFKSKIETAKETFGETKPTFSEDKLQEENEKDDSWLLLNLHQDEEAEKTVLAKDANLKTDDWFEIHDPRNVLNKRRRGEGKEEMRKKRHN